MLSVESLLETVLEFTLAPLIGYVARICSIEAVFLGMGGTFLLLNNLLLAGDWGDEPRLAHAKAAKAVEMMEADDQQEV